MEEELMGQIKKLKKENEQYKISMDTREEEIKIMEEKIKKLELRYKESNDVKNS